MFEKLDKSKSILAWLFENQPISDTGRPLELEDHYFLLGLMKDFSPKQAIMKAAQVGVSVTMVLKSFYCLLHRNYSIIYTLPAVDDVHMFVPSKVNTLIVNNKFLMDAIGNKDSVEQKKVGNCFIWYKGTYVEKQAIMLTSDLNIYDEIDKSNMAVIDVYSSRLMYSPYKGEWYLSNPSYPLRGIHRYYDLSDQKRWLIRCSRCNHQQFLEWANNVDRNKKEFVCAKCYGVLSREDRRVGEWKVTGDPNALFSGYHISQLQAPWVTAKELLEAESLKTREAFYNYYLGIPYVGSDITVSRDLILRNVKTQENKDDGVVMGVDQGLIKHYVIGNKKGIIKVGKTEKWEDIEHLMNFYNATVVIDALPDLTEPRRLRQKYAGKIYLCYFKRDRDKPDIIRYGEGDHYGTVYADRNKLIQLVLDELDEGKIKFNCSRDSLTELIDHFARLYKTYEKDSIGVERPIWNTPPGVADHLCLATCYYRIALEKSRSISDAPWRPTGFGKPSFEVTADSRIPADKFPIFEKETPDWLHAL